MGGGLVNCVTSLLYAMSGEDGMVYILSGWQICSIVFELSFMFVFPEPA